MRSTVGNEKQPFGKHSFLSSRRSSSSTFGNASTLRGIRINISSDPFQHRIPPYIQRLWQESKLRRHLSVLKRRLTKRYQQLGWLETTAVGVCIVMGCLVLLIHVGFFSGKKYQDWQHDHYHADALDEVDLLDKVYSDEGRAQTTAILLLRHSNKQDVESILDQLCQYDMFATFTIWNDDPSLNMTIDMIHAQRCTPNQLAMVNAPAEFGTSARYYACRQARTPYCYFQDIPLQNEQPHLRSTYANFLRSPHLIHGQSSNHQGFINSQWKYCFSNNDLQLHTCHVDIETGTFIAKAMVTTFLDNFDKSSVNDVYADMYFTMYINQVPYQLESDGYYIKQLTLEEAEHMDLGLTILYNDLEEDEGVVPLQPHVESPFERNARASCHDDRCLFLTNKQILPNIDLFSYNPTIDVNLSTQMHDDYRSNFKEDRYLYAVDGNDQTSWKTKKDIQVGDYIGLDLLMPMRTPLKYRFLVNQPYEYKSGLNIQISYDGLLWIKLHPAPRVSCHNVDSDDGIIQLLECRFIVTETGYRYIRLESQKNHDFAFDVYDFSFSAKMKKDASGQLLDMGLDEDGIAFVEDDFE